MNFNPKLLLLVAFVAGVGLTWFALRPSNAASTPAALQATATEAPAAQTVAPQRTAPRDWREADEEPSAEQTRATRERALADREAKFQAEPVSAAWAARTEDAIRDALSPASLKRAGVDTPLANLQATCRSFTCRVEVTYADQDEFELAQQVMLGNIAEQLPAASGFVEEQADGSLRGTIYASAAKPARSAHHH